MTDTSAQSDTRCQITLGDIVTYTEGECWVLAWVLRAITGWTPVYFIPQGRDSQDDFDHVLVRTPGGGLLDIYGEQTEAEVHQRWGQGVLIEVTSKQDLQAMRWVPRTEGDVIFDIETIQIAQMLLAELDGAWIYRP